MKPTCAMVLAAGFGLRMRPLTDTLPKPLIPVAGRCMLDRAIDRLREVPVERIVVNTHYLADTIEAHLHDSPSIFLSRENEILETGGGVKKALPLLGAVPFYVVNGDTIWTDGKGPTALERLAAHWDESRMDVLLLIHPTEKAHGYQEKGNFFHPPLRWRDEAPTAPYVYAGVQILHPRLFDGAPEDAFSLRDLYRKAFDQGRLDAVVHTGEWYHVGTPETLKEVESLLKPAISD